MQIYITIELGKSNRNHGSCTRSIQLDVYNVRRILTRKAPRAIRVTRGNPRRYCNRYRLRRVTTLEDMETNWGQTQE